MSEPVLFDRNGEPIRVGDRFVYRNCCNNDELFELRTKNKSGDLCVWCVDEDWELQDEWWLGIEVRQHYTKLKYGKVQELVRMGRNDLWARGDTEIKDGRVVAKQGETAVTILTTTLGEPFCCAYQRRGDIRRVNRNGSAYNNRTSNFDLIELSAAPKIEPWEFHEIPVGHWFRRKGSPVAFPCGPVDESDGTISVDDIWLNVRELLLDYEHCPTHCGEFQPCGKTT